MRRCTRGTGISSWKNVSDKTAPWTGRIGGEFTGNSRGIRRHLRVAIFRSTVADFFLPDDAFGLWSFVRARFPLRIDRFRINDVRPVLARVAKSHLLDHRFRRYLNFRRYDTLRGKDDEYLGKGFPRPAGNSRQTRQTLTGKYLLGSVRRSTSTPASKRLQCTTG